MRRLCTWLFFLAVWQSACGQTSVLLETNLPSRLVGLRHIQIYLPPTYQAQPQDRYPVLYLHDGQNVFSSAGTNAAFGWGSWALDQTADELSRAGKMPEIIMVAVDNSGFSRVAEYSGQHRGTNATESTAYENFAAFLLQELKPWVDGNFRTLKAATNTAVMGSSMGGICSLALAWDHPEIFGSAASLSGAFFINQQHFLNSALKPYVGEPKPFRIYLDSGVVDFMGGDDGRAWTAKVAAELRRIGWKDNLELFVDAKPLTPGELAKAGLRPDKWAEAQTSQHNEFYWRLRAGRALAFLFPPAPAK